MEEKKLNNENKASNPINQNGKLMYDELNSVCNQLYLQNKKLLLQIEQMDMSNVFKRLDYLFEVLKAASVIKDAEFITNCVSEIKSALYPQKDEPEDNDTQDKPSE